MEIATSKVGASVNEVLAQEWHKLVIKTFKGTRGLKIISELQISWSDDTFSKNRRVKYLLSVIDVFPKYAWVKPLTGKKIKKLLMVLLE